MPSPRYVRVRPYYGIEDRLVRLVHIPPDPFQPSAKFINLTA